MRWKFWRQAKSENHSADATGAKLPRPRELPQQVGGYLVVCEKLDPDWVWALKCVVRRHPERRSQFDFRVFDPLKAKQAGISIINYKSLDHQSELILYQGTYNKYAQYAQFDMLPTQDRAA